METKIFVMTDKTIRIPSDEYIPLQIANREKNLGYLTDESGDNIACRDKDYGMLTGIYWLWKNVHCDTIGICHSNKYFVRNEKLLDKAYIEKRIQQYPILVSNSICLKKDENAFYTVKEYIHLHFGEDRLNLYRQVINKNFKDYLVVFDYILEAILFLDDHMWITQKSIYDKYCKELFLFLSEVEKNNECMENEVTFLANVFLRVWLYMQPEKIAEENTEIIDIDMLCGADEMTDAMKHYIKLKVMPVTQLHRKDVMSEGLAMPLKCNDNFEGKIPVWVCWWQGKDQMPDVVRLCLDSLNRNLPKDRTIIRLITLENWSNYVAFTDTVLKKYAEGKISNTHLSDLLRMELLYRYGGMWIDATYYVMNKIPLEIFEREYIYTLRFEKSFRSADVTKGRYSGNLWCAPEKGKKLFQYVMECLWYYWECEDELMDYYLIDYLIAIAIDEFPEVKKELECVKFYTGKIFQLAEYADRKYTVNRMASLSEKELFCKLNWKRNYKTRNLGGEPTIYGYLMSNLQGEG